MGLCDSSETNEAKVGGSILKRLVLQSIPLPEKCTPKLVLRIFSESTDVRAADVGGKSTCAMLPKTSV